MVDHDEGLPLGTVLRNASETRPAVVFYVEFRLESRLLFGNDNQMALLCALAKLFAEAQETIAVDRVRQLFFLEVGRRVRAHQGACNVRTSAELDFANAK